MLRVGNAKALGATAAALVSVAALAGGAGALPTVPTTLHSNGYLAVPPSGSSGPDDVTRMAVDGLDGGRALIWTAFQNGINPDGSAGAPGGPTASTVAGFDPLTAKLVVTIPVAGKVDGLTADPRLARLIATDNEDSNSGFNLVDPETATVAHFTYSPDLGLSGGTDSIAVRDGHIFVVHSNPSDNAQAAEYEVTLDWSAHTAKLAALFFDNSTATDVVSGVSAPLNLSDPDTSLVMPGASPRFAGQLATISQGDGQIIFGSRPGHLKVLNLTDDLPLNMPPIDGMAVATSGRGTLYVVDAGAGQIEAFDTNGLPAGTVFVSEPKDNLNAQLGTLDLSTGKIVRLGPTFVSPKGLLFVPAGQGEDG